MFYLTFITEQFLKLHTFNADFFVPKKRQTSFTSGVYSQAKSLMPKRVKNANKNKKK